jgi:hypothetical protein
MRCHVALNRRNRDRLVQRLWVRTASHARDNGSDNPSNGTQPFTVRCGARKLGIYAVEHAAPGFLGSLALRVTQGSVSNPHERLRRLSYYDPGSG